MLEFKSTENIYLLLLTAIWIVALASHVVKKLKKRREAFASSVMLNRITSHKPTRRPIIKWTMIGLALFFIGIAILRPLGESYEEEINGTGMDLIVALDISKSMKACDIDGNSRLEVAKHRSPCEIEASL